MKWIGCVIGVFILVVVWGGAIVANIIKNIFWDED
jgi:hypothetical protein